MLTKSASEQREKITYLTVAEFLELAKKEQYRSQVIKAQKKLHNLTYPINLRLDEPFFPDLTGLIPETGIVAIKGYKGTGKTTAIKKLIKYHRDLNKRIVSITPRIALGQEQAIKWSINWINDDGYTQTAEIEVELTVEASRQLGLIGDPEIQTTKKKVTTKKHSTTQSYDLADAIGLCWDSLGKLFGRDWSNTVVIIDEVELGLTHLMTSSTCRDRRPFILKVLEEKIPHCLKTNGLLILSDADLTDVSLDYFKALSPDSPIFNVINVHKPQPWKIDFYAGYKDDVLNEIIDCLDWEIEDNNGQLRQLRIAVACDNQKELAALEQKILEKYPHLKCIRIDSTTTEEDWGKDFVQHANESIITLQPQILLYSPSLGVGVSIDVPWFDAVYGLFFGQLEPSQCRQMLARVREPVPRIIWCKDANHNVEGCRSYLPEVIKKNQFKFHYSNHINY